MGGSRLPEGLATWGGAPFGPRRDPSGTLGVEAHAPSSPNPPGGFFLLIMIIGGRDGEAEPGLSGEVRRPRGWPSSCHEARCAARSCRGAQPAGRTCGRGPSTVPGYGDVQLRQVRCGQLADRARVFVDQSRPPLVGGHAVRLFDAAISAEELEPPGWIRPP